MPRYPIPGAPTIGGGTVPYRGDSIADLIYSTGTAKANAQLHSGDIWANTIAGLGQNLGNAIVQRSQQKQMAKRDQAWVSYVQSGEWRKDPESAYGTALQIWGPEEGPKQFQGLTAAGRLSTAEKPNPEQDRKDLGVMIQSMKKMSPEARAALWPQAAAIGKKVLPEARISPEYDDKQWNDVIVPFGDALVGTKPPELKTATVPGPNGQPMLKSLTPEELAAGVPTYVAPTGGKKYEVTVPGPGGRPIKKLVTEEELAAGIQQYEAPKEPKEPRQEDLVQVDVNGVPTWVPKSQAAGKPAAQAARPPTGQERTALSFYNRAKDASETALKTEESIAEYGLKDQARLATGGVIGNFIKNDEMQSYRQAQRAFTEARLRKESGASVKDSEYEQDAKTYWAVPGDSKATIEQKRKAREKVLEGLRIGSGRAYREYYGEEGAGAPVTPTAAPAQFSVKGPNGKTYRFNTAAELDGFKKRAGIR